MCLDCVVQITVIKTYRVFNMVAYRDSISTRLTEPENELR